MSQEETRPLTQNAESNSDPLDASSGMRHRPTAKVLTADSRYYTPPIEPQNEAERKEAADDRFWGRVKGSGWIFAMIGIQYYTDFWIILLTDPRIGSFFYLGLAFHLASLSVFIYLWGCLSNTDWAESAPWAIPFAAATGVGAGLFYTIGLWPIWSFFTPVMLYIYFLGVINVLAFF